MSSLAQFVLILLDIFIDPHPTLTPPSSALTPLSSPTPLKERERERERGERERERERERDGLGRLFSLRGLSSGDLMSFFRQLKSKHMLG